MNKKKELQKNVLGEDLEECSNDPLTGWFRDGCCNTCLLYTSGAADDMQCRSRWSPYH